MTNHITRLTADCLIVAVTVLSSIPSVSVARTPHATGTLGKGDFLGKPRTFLPGAVTWGGLDYSCVETDCDQRHVLTFERPFELGFLGVRNSGKPTVRTTQGGKAVPCSIRIINADDYEVRFTKPLKLDAKPLEVWIGSK